MCNQRLHPNPKKSTMLKASDLILIIVVLAVHGIRRNLAYRLSAQKLALNTLRQGAGSRGLWSGGPRGDLQKPLSVFPEQGVSLLESWRRGAGYPRRGTAPALEVQLTLNTTL